MVNKKSNRAWKITICDLIRIQNFHCAIIILLFLIEIIKEVRDGLRYIEGDTATDQLY